MGSRGDALKRFSSRSIRFQCHILSRVRTASVSPDELREHARDTPTTTSNHSAIVLDEAASRCAAAFDLAIGRCRSYDTCKIDGGEFWQKLLRVADWRESVVKFDRDYYLKGLPPPDIKKQMNKPPAIPGLANESTESALYDGELRRINERIARLERERNQWPAREWEERMRDLKRQRRSVEQMHDMTRQRDTRFPVVNAE